MNRPVVNELKSLHIASNIQSGYIWVPEDHADNGGKRIKLFFVVIRAKSNNSKLAPLLFLTGGPGAPSLTIDRVKTIQASVLCNKRDIILFDQRGCGLSSPLPNMAADIYKVMASDFRIKSELDQLTAIIRKYKGRAEDAGLDFSRFNTCQSVRDIGMLMDTLDYAHFHVYGISYGARLARLVQSHYPDRIKSVMLNSPNPLSVHFLLSRLEAFDGSLKRLFHHCDQLVDGRSKNRNLQKKYLDGIDMIHKEPITVKTSAGLYVVNEVDALYLVRRALYRNNALELVPKLINALYLRKEKIIRNIIDNDAVLNKSFNFSMWLSVERSDSFDPEVSSETIELAYDKLSCLPYRLGLFDAFYRAGLEWPVKVRTNIGSTLSPTAIPTLIFVNYYDPVTPPEDSFRMLKTLHHAALLILDEGGHAGGQHKHKNLILDDFMNHLNIELDVSGLKLYEKPIVKNDHYKITNLNPK